MSQTIRPPSLASALLRWQRDSVRARGLIGSAKYLVEQFVECVKDSMPERRRSRFGDIDYDCDHAVDTTWARLPISVRLREVFSERLYQPTVEEEFAAIMQHLATVDLETYTFIDLGSGKGRALLLAAMYPFAQIVGVEVQPELDVIARQNIDRFYEAGQQCHSIELLCADAREYEFPSTDIVLYLFNPFPDYVLREVLANLVTSARSCPRSIIVLYNAPFEKQEFARIPELQQFYETSQFQLYRVNVS
ncbi:MAG TPA: methyltransferase domain-containing protein [Candidatus Saccharimonadales bacterium]|nr:methyltransferase domain-containing protein [Candidatus Saccharimonadales bacterium]